MSTDTTAFTDADSARTVLNTARDALKDAVAAASKASKDEREAILTARPAGVLTVDEIAEAVGRDRNYVDSVWSNFGETVKGKQTRVTVGESTEDEQRAAGVTLYDLAHGRRRSVKAVNDARALRDRLVAAVYASKLLGPSAIGAEAGMDRNHVLRVARRAGVPPMHRASSSNQHTPKD